MVSNGVINACFALFRMLIPAVCVPLFIQALGVRDYGAFSLIMTIAGIAALAELGVSTIVTVHVARALHGKTRAAPPDIAAAVALLSILALSVACILTALASPLSELLPKLTASERSDVTSAIRWIGIGAGIRLLGQLGVGIQQGAERYLAVNIIFSLQAIVFQLGALGLAFAHARLVWVGLFFAGTSLCATGAHLVVAYHTIPLSWRPKSVTASACRDMLVESLPIAAIAFSSALFSQVDRLAVGSLLGAEYLGFYSACTTIALQINALSALFAQPSLPFFAGSASLHGSQFNVVFRLVAAVSAICGIALYALAPQIMHLMAISHEQFPGGLTNFRILIVLYSLYSFNSAGYYLLIGRGHTRAALAIQVSAGILSVGFLWGGIYYLGGDGIIVGAIAYQTVWLLNIRALKHLKLGWCDLSKLQGVPACCLVGSACSIAFSDPAYAIWIGMGFCGPVLAWIYHYCTSENTVCLEKY